MKSFKEFIATKEQFYKEFEFESVSKAFLLLQPKLQKKKVIHIVGTNGKGSTGRALAYMLHKSGKKVTHYSSPHIKSYHERIWIDGKDVDDNLLNVYHTQLLEILGGKESELSYFEYFTLLAILLSNESEYLVLEAGLGGEFDATNVIESDYTILTPVGLDHQEFLGTTIQEIATTKIKACDNTLVMAKQPFEEVEEIASKLCKEVVKVSYEKEFFIQGFLGENIQTAIAALALLDIAFSKKLLEGFTISGRNQKIAKNIIVDVGHNPLAAQALVKNIETGTVLVYNAMKDKDIKSVLQILQPKIKRVEILPLENERAVETKQLYLFCKELGIEATEFTKIKDDEKYLVFGSFFTVEKFLKVEDL